MYHDPKNQRRRKENGARYWTTRQAATYVNMHPSTLLRMLKRKIPSPPHRRIGHDIRFPIDEFKKWVDGPYYKSQEQI